MMILMPLRELEKLTTGTLDSIDGSISLIQNLPRERSAI